MVSHTPEVLGPVPYRAYPDAPVIRWPNGAHVAVWIIPNIEWYPLEHHFAGSRPGESFAELAATAHRLGAAVMADVATLSEAEDAVRDGADMIATTMVGHTAATVGATRPPLGLLGQLLERLRVPVVIEGGVWTPEHVRDCFAAGAFAVVCGSAVTAPDIITRRLISGT